MRIYLVYIYIGFEIILHKLKIIKKLQFIGVNNKQISLNINHKIFYNFGVILLIFNYL